jgi:hypothetical protein
MNESPLYTETADAIHAARALLQRDRRQGLAAFNDLFRSGTIPDRPLNGPYDGELLAVDIAFLVTPVVEWLTSFWMPWKGKYLVEERAEGDNIFDRRWKWLLRLLFPFYRGMTDYGRDRLRAFTFKTWLENGKVDADRRVFRIDYDLPGNPGLTIRRIVDEAVQVADGVYLGKIHFHWWWGTWQMIGYFSLRRPA